MNTSLRQKILILHLYAPDLESKTVAWALYDGSLSADELQMQTGDSDEPPYTSALDAMRDGWRVIQFPQLPSFIHGHEHETGYLPYEYIMEKLVSVE